MNPPKILRQPTPDDLTDLLEIHDDIHDLLFEKHADKREIAAASMIYILASSIATKEELESKIGELRGVFAAQQIRLRQIKILRTSERKTGGWLSE